MNRIIFFIVSFCFASLTCNAQVNTTLKQLEGTEWTLVSPKEDWNVSTITFNLSTILYSTTYTDTKPYEKRSTSYNYYLSNKEQETFNHSNVGRITRGSYIVEYNHKMKEIYNYKIVSISDSMLTLYWKPKPNTVIGGNAGETFVYKRVKDKRK